MAIKNRFSKKQKNYKSYVVNSAMDDNSAPQSSVEKKAPFAVVEAYKAIRTNLMFLLSQENGKVLAFTSSNASEGKSTTSVNVAIAFSQLGVKVLIIDADLRRSSIHKKMRLENNDGLSNVVAGFSDFETAVQSANPHLDVLTAGPIPPNPSELLGSKGFEELMSKAREKYDYIIIDTPPLNIVTDALLIGPHTDGIILVVRDAFTPHDTIRRAISSAKFANIKILGAIMNGANPKNSRRYSYRRYGYKYGRYGYGYGGYGYGSYGYGNYGYSSRRSYTSYEDKSEKRAKNKK
ncbi:MAG: CpsD/CapB family tyrosine-protein kinase [Ruminococcaceae bacterium]|nr:CpsD/CapB family tyrosine-protein kinase [Oscillospiraceae bacterium]